MRKFLSLIFGILLVVQVISPYAFSQTSNRQFVRPLDDSNNDASGLSFRKSDMEALRRGASGLDRPEDMRTKGMMMTEPSMSGLMYQVHILGEVKNPGTYRITASDRLSEVLMKAGGIGEQGSQRSIEVRRKGEGTKVVDIISFQIFGNLADNPYLLDNDVVYVPLRKNTIQVVGAVMRPREYELKSEHNLSDVIKLAGGVSVGAAKDSPIRVVRYVDGKKEIEEVNPTESEMSGFTLYGGDVIFVPHVITEKNNFDYDLPKLPGDNIFYPSYEDRVFVLGGVGTPGAYPFNPYYKVSQYLSLAGGTTNMATNKITLVTPGGKKKVLKTKEKDTAVINPGDTIFVDHRRIPPEGWLGIVMGLAGFGLSTTATVLALTK